ncbi:thiamine diphosphokinase [Lachnoclostridium sp. An181]|uniref:thiamine diphosphokinase n=1 Tax=Lachnoclostridium sp. An181 TaxID=1965575 RepID=UPI000B3A74F7|nr:thiamine diphosphokinase [Lachnoclostridium sp. An181]OUP48691.1 thiamine diphosphokinase [Lachnoclostridium sp. An181]
MNKKTVIVSGGTIEEEVALPIIEQMGEQDCLIGVDRGMRFLYEHRINPTYMVGDFDSLKPEIVSYYKEETKVPVRTFNPEKDFTDTEIAVQMACQLGYKNILLLGGTGTRLDHVFANIQVLMGAYEKGANAVMLDKYNRISLISGRTVLKKEDAYGPYFSVFPIKKEIPHFNITGAKYPLKEHTLCQNNSLCVSNEYAKEEVVIDFPEGMVLLMETKDF